jgi:hypothetical protein
MFERKLPPIILVVFVMVAGISGNATVAVLSDSQTVTVNLGPDNLTSTVEGPQTDLSDVNESTSGSANTSEAETEDVEGLRVALEPTEQRIDADGKATYEVVVRGATEGINGYRLTFALSDPSVATFDGFNHRHDPGYSENEISDENELVASAGVGLNGTITGLETVNGSQNITLGTVTVEGNATGEATLDIVNEAVGDVDIINGSDSFYTIGTAGEATVNVTGPGATTRTESYTVAANDTSWIPATGIANDTESSSDTVSVSVAVQPGDGNATLATNGSFRYTPDSGFTGVDTFSYEARNGTTTEITTVSVLVTDDSDQL